MHFDFQNTSVARNMRKEVGSKFQIGSIQKSKINQIKAWDNLFFRL